MNTDKEQNLLVSSDAVIMMIDDEPFVMDVLEAYLVNYGYKHFKRVEDSRLAVKTILKEAPDLVLLDVNMPYIDGFELLTELRANLETKYLSVIVLTSSADPEVKLKALELGASDFLAKPVDQSELALRLRNTLTLKAYQDQLAYYDNLTKLPNRKLFLDRLDWALKCAKRSGEQVAVVNVAIDRFQQVNDMLGPQVGDKLLVEVSARLLNALRESDSVMRASDEPQRRSTARLGGDEFSILLNNLRSVGQIAAVAERVRKTLRAVFVIEDRDVFVTCSIGVATFPADASDTNTLMKQACAATAYAKEMGRDCYQFYSADINSLSQRRMSLEHSLRRVLERQELRLYYQPKISVASERVCGAEALLRWDSPEEGFISPAEFIPIAEETGIIIEIGEWVLNQACRQAVEWSNQGLTDLKFAVNVSARQFRDNSFPQLVQSVLKSTGLNPENLIIEITEGVLIGDTERTSDLLFKIKTTGAMLSIDDFGTGYSSLSYLKTFPIDELKIDRSFIVDVPQEEDSSAIVRAIVAMSKGLGLKVVAEGVETAAQLAFLKGLECDIIQGFYYARPMPADEFLTYYRSHNSD